MLLSVFCRLAYQVEHLTPAWVFLLGAHTDGQIIVSETVAISPLLPLHEGRDPFHNRSLYILFPPGPVELVYQAKMRLAQPTLPVLELAPDPTFLHASRYCCPVQVRPLLGEIWQDPQSELEAAQQICAWVGSHLHYKRGSSSSRTNAIDTILRGEGVCRDFTHVAISLCRAAGLPARYVSGYAHRLDPPDFHAMLEVFADGHWHLLDPTGMADIGQVVRVGVGRDAGDIPVAEFGESLQCKGLIVKVEEIPEATSPEEEWILGETA